MYDENEVGADTEAGVINQEGASTLSRRHMQNGVLLAKETRTRCEDGSEARRVALCIHAYYPKVFQEMIEGLPSMPAFVDLYVTCTAENHELVTSVLSERAIDANVLLVENMGMDVYPFLAAVRVFKLYRYLAIVKLHTKNDKHLKGAVLGRLMWRRTFGCSETIEALRQAFATQPELMLAGPNDTFKHLHFMMFNNRQTYNRLCAILGVDSGTNIGFFAGTTFWIRGDLLRLVDTSFERLADLIGSESRRAERTGGDGAIPHALERVWCALSPVKNPSLALIYRADLDDASDLIRIDRQSVLLSEPIRRVGMTEVIQIHAKAAENARVIKRGNLFDAGYYATQLTDLPNPGIDPVLHYVLYGEMFGLDPSATFNTTYYRLNRPDVERRRVSALAHYMNSGKRERMPTQPSCQEWITIAKRLHLFDDEFYRAEAGSTVDLFPSPAQHYKVIGAYLGLRTSHLFNPSEFKGSSPDRRVSLFDFLQNAYVGEFWAHQELIRVAENNDFELLGELAKAMGSQFGRTAAVRMAEILYAIHLQDWSSAESLLSSYWKEVLDGSLNMRHVKRLSSRLRQENSHFIEVERGPKQLGAKPRVCVYTALFGDMDMLPPVLSSAGNVDFVCFTDRMAHSNGWQCRVVTPPFPDPNLSAKIFKILPYEFLGKEYDYTLFVDANTLVDGRLVRLIEDYLVGNEFVMWAHPERNDIYTEVAAIVESRRHSPAALMQQIRAYHEAGMPKHAGMFEASFIWRSHHDPAVEAFMREWWEHILRYSKRDQLSLAFLSWLRDYRPKVLPASLGTARKNEFFTKVDHIKLPDEVVVGESTQHWRAPSSAVIWVLYGSRFMHSGSAVLRGFQLARLVQSVVTEDIDVRYSSFDAISGSTIVVTKGYVAARGEQAVAELKSRGNLVLLDLVDAKPGDQLVANADGLIASSIGAYKFYRSQYPRIPTFHVTHHVDLRLDGRRDDFERAQIGYFGELLNTHVLDQLRQRVTFTSVDTSRAAVEWMNTLASYNCHYAVRRDRALDGYKPFLKGFTAAHYTSNVIIQRDAGDAVHYLGGDYPYLLDSQPTSRQIIEMVNLVSESFGSSEWDRGMRIMEEVRHRSSVDFVQREIAAMFGEIMGKNTVRSRFAVPRAN